MSTAKPHLIIGTKNLSSWSLRPWLLLSHFGVDFQETELALDTPEFYARIGQLSPNRRVPALHDHDFVLWDSLALCEYINERYLNGAGWPSDLSKRALARTVVAEMHSGFAALRREMPMNILRQPVALADVSAEAQADIARVCALWRELLGRFEGPFLFGEFSIADCFYAPVATRFQSYAVAVGSVERAYIDTLYRLPAMQRWISEAARSN